LFAVRRGFEVEAKRGEPTPAWWPHGWIPPLAGMSASVR
jgi:hypothetical protein